MAEIEMHPDLIPPPDVAQDPSRLLLWGLAKIHAEVHAMREVVSGPDGESGLVGRIRALELDKVQRDARVKLLGWLWASFGTLALTASISAVLWVGSTLTEARREIDVLKMRAAPPTVGGPR